MAAILNVQGTSHNGRHDYTAHIDHCGHEEMFRMLFWVSLLLTISVLLYAEMIQMWLGFAMPTASAGRLLPVPGNPEKTNQTLIY